MSENPIPISTLFIGINGLLALVLSYLVVRERIRARVWHGESKEDVAKQPDPLANPSQWAIVVERSSQKLAAEKIKDEGVLQRSIRAHGNFVEYVPHALLFLVALELMASSAWLLWFLGSVLTLARIVYAWGVIRTYGPSIGRAVGFFLTWLVYGVASLACIYYGLQAASNV